MNILKQFKSLAATVLTAILCLTATAFAQTVNISSMASVEEIQNAIDAELGSHSVVTVTGSFTNTDDGTLSIDIPAGKKVTWSATYSSSATVSVYGVIRITGAGTMEITGAGEIENTGNGTALYIGDNAGAPVLIMAGGTIKATSFAINAGNNATVTINSGSLERTNLGYTVELGGNSILILNGGTVNTISAQTTSTIYVTGGTVNNINRNQNSNANAYYIGNHAAKFNSSWTTTGTGQNLFRLDGFTPALTAEDGSDYIYSNTTPHVGKLTATFPAGLAITDVSANPTTATHTFSDNTVVFAGEYNSSAITLDIEATLAGGKIPVEFTTAAFGVNVEKAEPTISNLTYSIPTNHTYNGTAQGIGNVTGEIGLGRIYVMYYDVITDFIWQYPINAGTYTVFVRIDEGDFYLAAGELVLGDYTIAPAPLTLKAENKSISVGDNEPTYTFSVAGLQGNDTKETAITENPTIGVTDFSSNAATEFAIVISGGATNSNYTIANYESGTLTVAEDNTPILATFKAQNINITLIGDKLRIDGIVRALPATPMTLRIYDLRGKTMMRKAITQNETISIAHLPKGVYMVNIGGQTVKFVK